MPDEYHFTGSLDKLLQFGEGDNLVKLALDLRAPHPENCAAQENVLASGEVGMKTGADFEQAADPSAEFNFAGGRPGDARKNFQQCRFAGAVVTDDADQFALADLQIDVVERPQNLSAVTAFEPSERRRHDIANRLAESHVAGCSPPMR